MHSDTRRHSPIIGVEPATPEPLRAAKLRRRAEPDDDRAPVERLAAQLVDGQRERLPS